MHWPDKLHVVFLDGKEQWSSRKSDLTRFIDLFHQGLIDQLFVGREVETDWPTFLEACLAKVNGISAPLGTA